MQAALAAAREASDLAASLGGLEEGEAFVQLALVETLAAAGDAVASAEALTAALARLEERAARIRNPELRRSFFENVPEHARLRELAGTGR